MAAQADIARIKRDIAKLEALAAKRRFRVRMLRAARGSLGAAASLAAMLKFKLAGSLALKIGLAAIVGLGFAWPAAALLAFLAVGFLLAIVSLLSGEGGPHDFNCDCPCECQRKEKRAAHLKALIERRTAWLASPIGPAPSALGKRAAIGGS